LVAAPELETVNVSFAVIGRSGLTAWPPMVVMLTGNEPGKRPEVVVKLVVDPLTTAALVPVGRAPKLRIAVALAEAAMVSDANPATARLNSLERKVLLLLLRWCVSLNPGEA